MIQIKTTMNKLLTTTAVLLLALTAHAQEYSKYYQNLPTKVAQVSRPQIPANEVSLTEVGGVGDGMTLNTEAFAKGISKLGKLGGGRLTVPQGVWLTGPIQLKDNIELHLDKNAIILMSPDKSLFINEKSTTKVFAGIRASKRKNIAITGEGIIDGNGDHWRPVKRQKVVVSCGTLGTTWAAIRTLPTHQRLRRRCATTWCALRIARTSSSRVSPSRTHLSSTCTLATPRTSS